MADFELFSPDREDITLVTDLPDNFRPMKLAGSSAIMARCSFGEMFFYHFRGDGFEIWKSLYDIRRDARVIGRTNQPVLELTFMYENSFAIDWQDVSTGQLPLKQVELYFAPYVDNTATFRGGKQYLTLDIHFQVSMLEQYADQFPLLDQFLANVQQNKPAKLFDSLQFASPAMNNSLRGILEYHFIDELAPRYYDAHVHLLLVLLLERISGFPFAAHRFTPADIALAYEARRLLLSDYQKSYTIKQLCRELKTNPYKLKNVFEHVFRESIGKYKRKAFMEYAEHLILHTDKSLLDISIELGYSNQQALHTPFVKHFGHPPGYWRKKKR